MKLGIMLTRGATSDGEHVVHIGVEQALAQHALADHAGCAEENNVHANSAFIGKCGGRDCQSPQIYISLAAMMYLIVNCIQNRVDSLILPSTEGPVLFVETTQGNRGPNLLNRGGGTVPKSQQLRFGVRW